MNDPVNILNRLFEARVLGKIFDLDEVELAGISWSCFNHTLCSLQIPSRASDFNATLEQLVNDVSSNEPSSTSNEDMSCFR